MREPGVLMDGAIALCDLMHDWVYEQYGKRASCAACDPPEPSNWVYALRIKEWPHGKNMFIDKVTLEVDETEVRIFDSAFGKAGTFRPEDPDFFKKMREAIDAAHGSSSTPR